MASHSKRAHTLLKLTTGSETSTHRLKHADNGGTEAPTHNPGLADGSSCQIHPEHFSLASFQTILNVFVCVYVPVSVYMDPAGQGLSFCRARSVFFRECSGGKSGV